MAADSTLNLDETPTERAPTRTASPIRRGRVAVRVVALLILLAVTLGAGELVARMVQPPPARGINLQPRVPLNSLGQHDVEHELAKPPGTVRVLCLGDSFTFGRGIDLPDLYCHRLERLLESHLRRAHNHARVESLSFAAEGYSTARELRMLERRGGLDYRPDVLVLGYVLNDPEDESNPDELKRLREPTMVWHPRGWMGWLTRNSALTGWMYQRLENTRRYRAFERYYHFIHRPEYPGWRRCQESFQRLAELTKASGTQVLVAIFPFVDFPLGEKYPFEDLHEQVAELARSNGFAALDLRPTLAAHESPALQRVFGLDPHPSAGANHLVARAIADEIVRLGWLKTAPSVRAPEVAEAADARAER
ncbi:MAG: GDSL-type esterase/lipase family protein [bacterium]